MSDHRAIQCRYADWRPVKGRKVLQLVFEVPLEQQGDVLSMLGAPMPDRDLWVAVAILREEPGEIKGGKLAQMAGIICNEGAFQQYVAERLTSGERNSDAAAEYIRWACGVESRAMLDHDEEAARLFRDLKADYELWLKGVAA